MKQFKWGLIALVAMIAVSCASPTQQQQTLQGDTQLMARQLQQYRLAQPLHFYTYSQDLATMNAVMDARTAGKSTWSAEFIPNVADPIFTCNSRGYPIPGDAELTNPDQIQYYSGGSAYGGIVVPQIDPNGPYSSHSTNSTYVVCIDTDGSAFVHYSEPLISVWPFAMTWDYTRHQAVKADGNAKASYTVPLNDKPELPQNAQLVQPTATPGVR